MNTPIIHKATIADEINRTKAMLLRAEQIGVRQAAILYQKHPSTLWRAKNKVSEGGLPFDRRHLNPGAASRVDETRLKWALGYMADRQGIALAQVCNELNKVALREAWPQTNYHALRRAIEKLSPDLKTLLTEGGKAVLVKCALVGRRVSSRPLELVQKDFTAAPLWTVHPATGETIMVQMTGIIDTFSRVVLGVEFHLNTPDAIDGARCLTRAFLPKNDPKAPFFGMPETVNTDNAQIYIGKLLSGVAVRAGFVLDSIPVGCPGANGKIERFFGTFESLFFSKLPGYSAQSYGKFKAESRGVVPFAVLQSLANRALFEYHSTVHSELGKTPWEAWHENINNAPGYFLSPKIVREKMRIEVAADVTREGVTVLGTNYSGPCLSGHVGKSITALSSADGGDQSVDAYDSGIFIGKLRPVALVADAINKARLKRQIGLSEFRKKMRQSLADCPPVDSPETVIPGEERKRIKASQTQPKRNSRIKPVKFEVEPIEDNLP